MNDPRLARLGELIVGYSIGLKPDQIIRIDSPSVATPLAEELYRAALRAGGYPYANVELESLEELSRRAGQLAHTHELRIVGPDTDLRIVVDGRRWEAADGRYNMPDGEVYSSPVETKTEGEIRFTFPALFQGREVEDIRLRFEGGSVVRSEARRGGGFLDALLSMDDRSRRVRGVALGLNYEIDR